MKNKINIAELLKDCPKGMELDCASYDNVSFDKISDDKKATYPIFCYITDKEGNRSSISFTENGYESKRYGAKCVIFPKGKTTWEGFVPPCKFKDGDVVVAEDENITQMFIVKNCLNPNKANCYIGYEFKTNTIYNAGIWLFDRIATEEEKQKLFDVIKENGYQWNAETKTLEKLIEPNFKVGDRIKHKESGIYCNIGEYVESFKGYKTNIGLVIRYDDIDNWELYPLPNKFDINTLKPFKSNVLVRSTDDDVWRPAIYGFANSDRYYIVGGIYWKQCIPYEGNEHLLGTTDNCNEYYETW